MSHRHNSPGPVLFVLMYVSECDHPDRMSFGRGGATVSNQLPRDVTHIGGSTTAKSSKCNLKYCWVSHRRVEPRGASLDLSNDHVWPIRGAAQNWISGHVVSERFSVSATNDMVAGSRKTEREYVEVGDGSSVIAPMSLQDRVLRDSEVAVHVEVRLNERDSSIHSIT